jgi:hypothetical protein
MNKRSIKTKKETNEMLVSLNSQSPSPEQLLKRLADVCADIVECSAMNPAIVEEVIQFADRVEDADRDDQMHAKAAQIRATLHLHLHGIGTHFDSDVARAHEAA